MLAVRPEKVLSAARTPKRRRWHRAAASRVVRLLEHVEHCLDFGIRLGRIPAGVEDDLAFASTKSRLLPRGFIGRQARNGLAGLADDDLFAGARRRDQLGKLRLGL